MDQTTASQVNTAELASLLQVIANPLRLEILFCLLERPRCVCELAEEFNCRQPNISQNLMRLRKARWSPAAGKDGISGTRYRRRKLSFFLTLCFCVGEYARAIQRYYV